MGWIRSCSARYAIHISCKELGGSHKLKRNVDQSGQGLRPCFTRKTGRRHRSLLLPRLCGETRVVWVIRSFCFIGRFHFIQTSSEKIESDWKMIFSHDRIWTFVKLLFPRWCESTFTTDTFTQFFRFHKLKIVMLFKHDLRTSTSLLYNKKLLSYAW